MLFKAYLVEYFSNTPLIASSKLYYSFNRWRPMA